jgi:hypothetical protein
MNIKKHDVLAIVGGYTDTRKLFDWKRTDCDILMFNEAPFSVPWAERCDICIQLHAPVIWRNPTNSNDPKHYERLKVAKIPVLMQEVYPDVPMSVKYPLDEIKKISDFLLSSSAAEGIAWGMYSGYSQIDIYGVEMATNTEYATQRPGVTYWVGLARGSGITVNFYNNTFITAIYGFEGDVKISEEKFAVRMAELELELAERTQIYNTASKMSSDIVSEYIETGKGDDLIPEAVKQLIDASYKLGLTDGARQIVAANLKRIQTSKEATDDFITNRQMYERDTVKQTRESERLVMEATKWGMNSSKRLQFARGAAGNKGKRKYRMEEFIKSVVQYKNLSNKAGGFKGAALENQSMMILLGELVNAAGGMKSLEVMTKVGTE